MEDCAQTGAVTSSTKLYLGLPNSTGRDEPAPLSAFPVRRRCRSQSVHLGLRKHQVKTLHDVPLSNRKLDRKASLPLIKGLLNHLVAQSPCRDPRRSQGAVKELNDITCFNCDQKGHYAATCRAQKNFEASSSATSNSNDSSSDAPGSED